MPEEWVSISRETRTCALATQLKVYRTNLLGLVEEPIFKNSSRGDCPGLKKEIDPFSGSDGRSATMMSTIFTAATQYLFPPLLSRFNPLKTKDGQIRWLDTIYIL
jgi:hypothetical protein